MIRKRSRRVLAALLAGACLLVTLLIVFLHSHRLHFRPSPLSDEAMVSSCANHAGLLRFQILFFEEAKENLRYPDGTDARAAMIALGTNTSSTTWFYGSGSACPEAFLLDRSLGYVYFGDGLPTRLMVDPKPLILMCPADSHQKSARHAHVLRADQPLECLNSNADAIRVLEFELNRAIQGIVPYSTHAIALFKREIALRQGYERGRSNAPVSRTFP